MIEEGTKTYRPDDVIDASVTGQSFLWCSKVYFEHPKKCPGAVVGVLVGGGWIIDALWQDSQWTDLFSARHSLAAAATLGHIDGENLSLPAAGQHLDESSNIIGSLCFTADVL